MLAKLHFPTESFGFAEVEIEVESVSDALEAYREARSVGVGLDKKAFDAFLERQLLGDANHIDEYEQMSQEQKTIVQAVKRALARIANKNV